MCDIWCCSCVPWRVSQVLTLLFPKYCTEGAQIEPQPSDYNKIFDNVTREMKQLGPNNPAVRSTAPLVDCTN
jgi:hypothetical protein